LENFRDEAFRILIVGAPGGGEYFTPGFLPASSFFIKSMDSNSIFGPEDGFYFGFGGGDSFYNGTLKTELTDMND
jgi:hypothetical protein